MKIRLEHANLCVHNIESMIDFLKTVCPEFRIRGEGGLQNGKRWVHIGSDDTYIALQQAHADRASKWEPYSGAPGVNHLAYEVDDVESLRARLNEAGYKETTVPNDHPFWKRIYFNDPEGNDWEFVQYFSQNPSERNDYETPDK